MHIYIQYTFYFLIFTALILRRTSFDTADSDSDSWIPSKKKNVNKVHIKNVFKFFSPAAGSSVRRSPLPVSSSRPIRAHHQLTWSTRARLFNCICVGLLAPPHHRLQGGYHSCRGICETDSVCKFKQVRCQNIAVRVDLLLPAPTAAVYICL